MIRSFLLSCVAMTTAAASADTITVCASGCDHTSINDAIAAASDGDVIQLAAETYREGEQVDTQNKSITIRGTVDKNGDPTTVLDGQGSHRVLYAYYSSADEVIEDLVISNGFLPGSSSGGGAFAGNTTFRSVWFFDNTASQGAAIQGSDLRLERCKVDRSVGTSALQCDGSIIVDCDVRNSNDTTDQGIRYPGECEISGTTIAHFQIGVLLIGSQHLQMNNCVLSENRYGIYALSASVQSILHSSVITSSTYSGIFLSDAWLNIDDSTIESSQGQGILSQGSTGLSIANSTICGHPDGQVNGSYTDLGGNSINETCDCLDSDGDGICDEYDECPGAPDVDTDGDGVVDCLDGCPLDPAKTDPGRCGCGFEDSTVQGDFNCDGVFDFADYAAMGEALGTCPGDLNGDGEVSGADMGLLLMLYGTTCS